ncbi:ATP-binding protein [Candidatus Parcubacteria bacterium]|jgi:hypothetical protein|nr:ATP-binding protein [Candidatus Parcubacteria bacterium]MBT3948809.1 ATP-binding protein [Candidatus Parcubacteria bacterium]
MFSRVNPEGFTPEVKENKDNNFGDYIKYFRDVSNKVLPNLKESIDYLSEQRERDPDYFDDDELSESFEEWKTIMKEKISELFEQLKDMRNEVKENGLAPYVGHDLSNISGALVGFLELSLEDFESKKMEFFRSYMERVVKYWDRYWVSLEDVLLRGIDKDSISQKYCNNFNIDSLGKAVSFLATTEYDGLKRDAVGKYTKLKDKKVDVDVDVDSLKDELKNKDVKAPTGFVGNFIFNAMRNVFQDRIEASHVRLDIKIDKDSNQFVVRIIDDGKGMSAEHLDENNPINKSIRRNNKKRKKDGDKELNTYYIFEEGSSGDSKDLVKKKSTGLGLANFAKRITSIGGTLRVATRRKENGEETYFSNVDAGDLPPLEMDTDHGTVFEVRIPIVDK